MKNEGLVGEFVFIYQCKGRAVNVLRHPHFLQQYFDEGRFSSAHFSTKTNHCTRLELRNYLLGYIFQLIDVIHPKRLLHILSLSESSQRNDHLLERNSTVLKSVAVIIHV